MTWKDIYEMVFWSNACLWFGLVVGYYIPPIINSVGSGSEQTAIAASTLIVATGFAYYGVGLNRRKGMF